MHWKDGALTQCRGKCREQGPHRICQCETGDPAHTSAHGAALPSVGARVVDGKVTRVRHECCVALSAFDPAVTMDAQGTSVLTSGPFPGGIMQLGFAPALPAPTESVNVGLMRLVDTPEKEARLALFLGEHRYGPDMWRYEVLTVSAAAADPLSPTMSLRFHKAARDLVSSLGMSPLNTGAGMWGDELAMTGIRVGTEEVCMEIAAFLSSTRADTLIPGDVELTDGARWRNLRWYTMSELATLNDQGWQGWITTYSWFRWAESWTRRLGVTDASIRLRQPLGSLTDGLQVGEWIATSSSRGSDCPVRFGRVQEVLGDTLRIQPAADGKGRGELVSVPRAGSVLARYQPQWHDSPATFALSWGGPGPQLTPPYPVQKSEAVVAKQAGGAVLADFTAQLKAGTEGIGVSLKRSVAERPSPGPQRPLKAPTRGVPNTDLQTLLARYVGPCNAQSDLPLGQGREWALTVWVARVDGTVVCFLAKKTPRSVVIPTMLVRRHHEGIIGRPASEWLSNFGYPVPPRAWMILKDALGQNYRNDAFTADLLLVMAGGTADGLHIDPLGDVHEWADPVTVANSPQRHSRPPSTIASWAKGLADLGCLWYPGGSCGNPDPLPNLQGKMDNGERPTRVAMAVVCKTHNGNNFRSQYSMCIIDWSTVDSKESGLPVVALEAGRDPLVKAYTEFQDWTGISVDRLLGLWGSLDYQRQRTRVFIAVAMGPQSSHLDWDQQGGGPATRWMSPHAKASPPIEWRPLTSPLDTDFLEAACQAAWNAIGHRPTQPVFTMKGQRPDPAQLSTQLRNPGDALFISPTGTEMYRGPAVATGRPKATRAREEEPEREVDAKRRPGVETPGGATLATAAKEGSASSVSEQQPAEEVLEVVMVFRRFPNQTPEFLFQATPVVRGIETKRAVGQEEDTAFFKEMIRKVDPSMPKGVSQQRHQVVWGGEVPKL